MVIIYIKDLIFEGKHGVKEAEKKNTQRFKINIELDVDSEKATKTDSLDDTMNYSTARDVVSDIIKNKSFNLLEKLAQEISDRLLENEKVISVTISIDKMDIWNNGVPGVRLRTDKL